MKKGLFLFFFAALFGLASCGKQEKVEVLDKKGPSVFTPAFVEANYEETPVVESPIAHPKLIADKEMNYSYELFDKNNKSEGIVAMKNTYGYVGFYSTYLNQYIIEPCYQYEFLNYKYYSVPMIGSIVQVRYDDEYIFFDPFGNFFDLSSDIYSYLGITSSIVYDNSNKAYVVVKMYNVQYADYYDYSYDYYSVRYIYSSDGSCERYYGEYDRNSAPAEEEPYQDDDYLRFALGDLYTKGWISLSPFGLDGYSIVSDGNGYCTVFYGETAKSSFFINEGNEYFKLVGFFNKKILCQQSIILPDDSTNYSYSIGNKKYSLETFYIDINTGERIDANFDIVFSYSESLYNESKQIEFFEVGYQKINSQKNLSVEMTKIIDSNLAVRDDITGLSIKSFKRVEYAGYTYYYNTQNKILFNEDLKPLTYLNGLYNINFVKGIEAFVCTNEEDGLLGVVAPNGKILAQFQYNRIFSEYAENGRVIMTKSNGDAYLLDENSSYSSSIEFIGSNFEVVTNNLFSTETSYSRKYFSTQGNIATVSLSSDRQTSFKVTNNILAKCNLLYFDSYYYNYYYSSYETVAYDYEFTLIATDDVTFRTYTMDEKYTEINSSYNNGLSASTAIMLTEGKDQILRKANDNMYSYFYIPNDVEGYYYIDSTYPISSYTDYNYYSSSPSNMDSQYQYNYSDSGIYYEYRTYVYLQRNTSYCFRMSFSSSGSRKGYVNFHKAANTSSSYPTIYSAYDNYYRETYINDQVIVKRGESVYGGNYRYVSAYLKANSYYSFECSASNSSIDYYSSYYGGTAVGSNGNAHLIKTGNYSENVTFRVYCYPLNNDGVATEEITVSFKEISTSNYSYSNDSSIYLYDAYNTNYNPNMQIVNFSTSSSGDYRLNVSNYSSNYKVYYLSQMDYYTFSLTDATNRYVSLDSNNTYIFFIVFSSSINSSTRVSFTMN